MSVVTVLLAIMSKNVESILMIRESWALFTSAWNYTAGKKSLPQPYFQFLSIQMTASPG